MKLSSSIKIILLGIVPFAMSVDPFRDQMIGDAVGYGDNRSQRAQALNDNFYVLAIQSESKSRGQSWDTFYTGTPQKISYMGSEATVALKFTSRLASRQTNNDSAYENEFSSKDEIHILSAEFFSSKVADELIKQLQSGRYRMNIILKAAPEQSSDKKALILSSKNIERIEIQDLLDNVVVNRFSSK